MKSIKKENGAITIITLLTVLFMVSFLVSSYILISNKVKTQKDIINETRDIYESKSTMEEIYDSYFNIGNIVPIYTPDQLLMMGTNIKNVNINGKYYDFNNDENTIYVLMNDLKFKASDYEEQLTNGYWMSVGDRIIEYENLSSEELQDEELTKDYFKAKFEGKNNNIEVIYTDSDNSEYSVIYSEDSKYCEPEYEVNVIPRFADETIADNAKILLNDEDTGLIGRTKVKVRRLSKTFISAYLNEDYTSSKEEILIINPNEINDIYLKLESQNVTLTIEPIPKDAIVTINSENRNSISVPKGTIVNYEVSCNNYHSKSGNIQVNKNMVVSIELASLEYVPFSTNLYFTRCDNQDYKGLLNGGKATVSHYNLVGEDVSMGSFYIDEADIVKQVPSDAIIDKVTLYFDYYQNRSNTFLYTNRIKTTFYTGNTEKMEQQETENANKTVKQAKYELYNISRKDLEEGIRVDLVNYIEVTLKIDSSIQNMYCVIEGKKLDR